MEKLYYKDQLFLDAAKVILTTRVVSAGRLQSELQIGSIRATKLLQELEELGVIGPAVGNMKREIFFTIDQWLEIKDNFIWMAPEQAKPVQQSQKQADLSFCKHCGKSMQSNAEFCPNCGKSTSKKRKYPLLVLGFLFIFLAIFLASLVSAPESDKTYPVISKSEYVDMCRTIDYDTLARNPNAFKGEHFKFTGEVIQVLQKGNTVNLRVNVTAETIFDSIYYSDTIYVVATLNEDGSRILEDDIITIYGECMGLYSYTTVLGDQASIPRIDAEYWDLK